MTDLADDLLLVFQLSAVLAEARETNLALNAMGEEGNELSELYEVHAYLVDLFGQDLKAGFRGPVLIMKPNGP